MSHKPLAVIHTYAHTHTAAHVDAELPQEAQRASGLHYCNETDEASKKMKYLTSKQVGLKLNKSVDYTEFTYLINPSEVVATK